MATQVEWELRAHRPRNEGSGKGATFPEGAASVPSFNESRVMRDLVPRWLMARKSSLSAMNVEVDMVLLSRICRSTIGSWLLPCNA